MDFLKKLEAQLDTAVGGPSAHPEASARPEAGADAAAAAGADVAEEAPTAERLASAVAWCKRLEARLAAKTDLCADKDAQIAAVRPPRIAAPRAPRRVHTARRVPGAARPVAAPLPERRARRA